MGASPDIVVDKVTNGSRDNFEKDRDVSVDVQPYADIDAKEERAFV